MPQSLTYRPLRTVTGVRLSPEDLSSPTAVASGGFATLWRAGDKGQYAIKCFNNGGMTAAEEEFEALLMLSGQRAVPQVYGLGTFVDGMEQGSAAIVEEYVDGYTLASVLKRGLLSGSVRTPVLDMSLTIAIANEIAHALEQLERAGVAHRDLSANNVVLGRECVEQRLSQGIQLSLIDFGQSTPTARPSVTPSFRARLATVPYGAPEMYGGKHWKTRNSSKCDVWSFGSIIVTMLVGEYWPPEISDLTAGISSAEDLARIAEAKRNPLDLAELMRSAGHSVGDMERRLSHVVRCCTQYDPSNRPTAVELARLLEGLAPGNTPRTPRRPTATAQTAKGGMPQRQGAQTTGRSMPQPQSAPTSVRSMPRPQGSQGGGPSRVGAHRAPTPPFVPQRAPRNADFNVEGTTLIRYAGRSRQVAVPEGVTAIGARAFAGCMFVERVLLPESVRVLGDYAFDGCAALRGIAVSGVERLGVGVFRGCVSLPSLTIREPVGAIPWYAFKGCASLEWIELPRSIRSIGREAFADCVSLTHIEIPNGVIQVGERAFANCSSLGRVIVPDSVSVVGEGAFATGARMPVAVDSARILRRRILAVVAGILVVTLLGATLALGLWPFQHKEEEETPTEETVDMGVTVADDEYCTIKAYPSVSDGDGKVYYPLDITSKSKDALKLSAAKAKEGEQTAHVNVDLAAQDQKTTTIWFDKDDSSAHKATLELMQGDKVLATYAFDTDELGL